MDLEPLWLTLELASITTALLLLIGIPLAWWLAQQQGWMGAFIGSVIALPLILPPTVLGFYLLVAMGPHGPLGELTNAAGLGSLAFTFPGLVVGSMIYSLPFVVQPLQAAFKTIGHQPMEAAATLRASPLDRFITIELPLARSGIVTGTTLGFAHTVGEFGVVLMIGGNIPGQTKVLSLAIYDYVENMQYHHANILSGGMLVFSLLVLMLLRTIAPGQSRSRP